MNSNLLNRSIYLWTILIGEKEQRSKSREVDPRTIFLLRVAARPEAKIAHLVRWLRRRVSNLMQRRFTIIFCPPLPLAVAGPEAGSVLFSTTLSGTKLPTPTYIKKTTRTKVSTILKIP